MSDERISSRMAGLMVLIRSDGWISWPGRSGTFWALVRRGLVEGPCPHPSPNCAALGWQVARLTPAGEKFLDEKGIPPTPVPCPHCNGTGRVASGHKKELAIMDDFTHGPSAFPAQFPSEAK